MSDRHSQSVLERTGVQGDVAFLRLDSDACIANDAATGPRLDSLRRDSRLDASMPPFVSLGQTLNDVLSAPELSLSPNRSLPLHAEPVATALGLSRQCEAPPSEHPIKLASVEVVANMPEVQQWQGQMAPLSLDPAGSAVFGANPYAERRDLDSSEEVFGTESATSFDRDVMALSERLRRLSAQGVEANAELVACRTSLFETENSVRQCADELNDARGDLAEFQALVYQRQAQLFQVESNVRELQKLVAAEPLMHGANDGCASAVSRKEMDPSATNLQKRLDELEAEHMTLLQQCKAASRDANRRAERTHLLMKQDLERREQQARQCGRLLEDCGTMDERLRSAYSQRFARFRKDLDMLQQTHDDHRATAAKARADSQHHQQQWQVEKAALLKDMARLEGHLTELKEGAISAELAAEEVEQMRHSEDVNAKLVWTQCEGLRESTTRALQNARCAEGEIQDLLERRRNAQRLLADERELCSALELQVKEARTQGGGTVNGRQLLDRRITAPAISSPLEVPVEDAMRLRTGGSRLQAGSEEELRQTIASLRQQQEHLESQLSLLAGESC